MSEKILVLDFGGQHKELAARRVRGLGVFTEIMPGSTPLPEILARKPGGIILTGRPLSAAAQVVPPQGLFDAGLPILGICSGMQLMCQALGGCAEPKRTGGYSPRTVHPVQGSVLFGDDASPRKVLMSHLGAVTAVPPGFAITARTDGCIAAMENAAARLFGVQFHPESLHTHDGDAILRRFLDAAGCARYDYNPTDCVQGMLEKIQQEIGGASVLLALSGGLDSSVCARLLARAVPGQVWAVFVDHGLMREGDERLVREAFGDLNLVCVDARERFYEKLRGVTNPEDKRMVIGREFAAVFEQEAKKLGDIPFLAQGTIYPDVVESGGTLGALIKTHHNVGGLPKNLSFKKVIEPLERLFKNEVRQIGEFLGLPHKLLHKQPFPGPGLAVRILGEITPQKIDILRHADKIFCDMVDGAGHAPDQYFAVLTDSMSVGVKGDERTYDHVVALRAVVTEDFMTAGPAALPHDLLLDAAAKITGEISAVSRVVYDITPKPPGTIEWL